MESALKVRRARRGDFARVRSLLGAGGPPVPAERKRFRRLVSTLREDLYLVERERDAALVGLALIVYARGVGPPTAIVRRLLGATDASAGLLLACARDRARARGCTQLEVQLGTDEHAPAMVETLRRSGWREGPPAMLHSLGK